MIARIFLGRITKWNDPAIKALNPGADLPDAWITAVHRSDGSGTTYIFSNYLSAVSPAWATSPGTGRSLHWPTGYGARGNAGVAAAIRNQAGRYTTPTTAAITAAAAAKPAITPDDFSIVNQPGPAAYPISGYSWVLVSARQPGQATGKALTALLRWLTSSGQADAATLGYVPLPPAIQQLARTTLARVTGPSGQPVTR